MLQPKYPKSKPSIQINLYVEDDQPVQLDQQLNSSKQSEIVQLKTSTSNISLNNSLNSVVNENNKRLQISLIESEGYFQLGAQGPNCHTYILTITIAFARNLIRVINTFFLKILEFHI